MLNPNGVIIIIDSLDDRSEVMLDRCIRRSPGLYKDQFIISTIDKYEDVINSIPSYGINYKQKVILALGPLSFRTLSGLSGPNLGLNDIRGYPIETQYGLLLGSYHPLHIMQGSQKLMGVLMLDIKKSIYLAKNGFIKKPIIYQDHPSYDDMMVFYNKVKDNPDLTLAFDIETPYTSGLPDEIYSMQYSLEPYIGIFLNWSGVEGDIAKDILRLSNDKIAFNGWTFDVPVIRKLGFHIEGRIDDPQVAFHHYQPDITTEDKEDGSTSVSTRMSLQYVASMYGMDFHWKYMKYYKEMDRTYGIADVDALQRIWFSLPKQMKQMGIWKGYDKLRHDLYPVLTNMTLRGIPVIESERVKLKVEIEEDKVNQFKLMQSCVPEELLNYEPKEGYKKGWSAVKEKEGKIRKDDSNGYTWYDTNTSAWYPIRDVTLIGGEVRPARIKPFKPSNDQLIRYMKVKGHRVPMKKGKPGEDKKETGEQKELVKLYRSYKDPLYQAVLEYRGCETALSRYVDKWIPTSLGRVHPSFGFLPASGQLNSVNPNAQNIVKHGSKDGVDRKYAPKIRGLIKAREGCVLLEADYIAYHGVTTGYCARDLDYMRLARLDLHSFLTAHFMNIQKIIPTSDLPDVKWSDVDLKAYLDDIKYKYKVERDLKAKPAGLGYGFGMGPNKLHTLNEDTISLKDAKTLMGLLDDLFPIAKAWRKSIKDQADRQGYLISPHGFIRWFWDVYGRKKQDNKWVFTNGSDAEDAIAFLPSNTAHCHIQERMIQLEVLGYNNTYGLINMIHDALLFEIPEDNIEQGSKDIRMIMESPSTTLIDPKMAPLGLVVGVDIMIGKSWDKMKGLK